MMDDMVVAMRKAVVMASPLSKEVKEFLIQRMGVSAMVDVLVSALCTCATMNELNPAACSSISACLGLLGFEGESLAWEAMTNESNT